jgi:hypothetical protein
MITGGNEKHAGHVQANAQRNVHEGYTGEKG